MRFFKPLYGLVAAWFIAAVLIATTSPIAVAGSIEIRASKVEAATGSEVEVPITVQGDKGTEGVQFVLSFDSDVLEHVAIDAGSTAGAGEVSLKIREPGKLRVVLLPEKPLSEDGTLLVARFKVIGKTGSTSAIKFSEARAFEFAEQAPLEMLVTTESGMLTVADQVQAERKLPLLWIAIAAGVVLLLILITLMRRGKGKV